MPHRRRYARIVGFSLANALVMLVLTFVWLGLPYTFGDEAFFIKWTALTKKSLLGIDRKPPPESVLFVDISGNKTVIDQPNDFGEMSDYHRLVITDRVQLAEFLELIVPHRDETQLVVLDVLLDQPARGDSLLQAKIDALGDKILGVTHLGEDGRPLETVIDFPERALATYRSVEGSFLKYPLLFQDSLRTVPLRMFERLHGVPLDYSGWFYRFDSRISLRNPIVDYKVRAGDFRVGNALGESNYTVFQMGTIVESSNFMAAEDVADYFRGKLVLVGDFKNDLHATPFGNSPGLLLIYNAYLSLAEGNNLVSYLWVFLLFCGYLVVSWRVFNDIEFTPPRVLAQAMDSRLGRWTLDALDDAFFLILFTVLSYFLFNVHINILILLLYLKIIEFFWNRHHQPTKIPNHETTTV